jgi:hypothetical protein
MNVFESIRSRFVAGLICAVLTFIGTATGRLLDRFVPAQHEGSVKEYVDRAGTDTEHCTSDDRGGRTHHVLEPCHEPVTVTVSKKVLVCD